MDKPLRQHITELERRVQRLSQEIMQNAKTQMERPGQDKLPEADFAVEAFNPAEFVQAVQAILTPNG